MQLQLVQMLDFYCLWAAAGNLISVTWLNFQPKTTWWGMSDEICRPDIFGPQEISKLKNFPNCPFQSNQIVIILMLIVLGFSKVEDTLHCPPLLFVNLVTETFGLDFFQPCSQILACGMLKKASEWTNLLLPTNAIQRKVGIRMYMLQPVSTKMLQKCSLKNYTTSCPNFPS